MDWIFLPEFIGGPLENVEMKVDPGPEPSTMLLLGSGLGGLAGFGRRKFFKKLSGEPLAAGRENLHPIKL
jgi:hypothetical protein